MLAHARGGEMTSRRPVTDLPGMYRELIRLGSVWQPSRTLAMARACAGQASQALAAVTGGFLIAMAALGIAVARHWLSGPTLIGSGSVPAEEVALGALAAAWGWRVAERRRRAWFLPTEASQRDGHLASPAGPAQGNGPPAPPE